MSSKLTEYQQHALDKLRKEFGRGEFKLKDTFGLGTTIKRHNFTLDTLYKKGVLDREVNRRLIQIEGAAAFVSDEFWLYRVKPTPDTIYCLYCEAMAEAPDHGYPLDWGFIDVIGDGPYYACPDHKEY